MLTILLFLCLLGGEPSFFQGSFQEALATAKAQNKQVFVDVYTDWCGPCRRMDRTTFRNKDVVDLFAKDYVVIKINAEKGEGIKLARQFKVRAYPSLLVLDGDGKVLKQRMGFLNATQLVDWLATKDGGTKGVPAE